MGGIFLDNSACHNKFVVICDTSAVAEAIAVNILFTIILADCSAGHSKAVIVIYSSGAKLASVVRYAAVGHFEGSIRIVIDTSAVAPNITVDRAAGTWSGNVGVVTTLISKAQFNSRNTVAMICGPEVMMRFTVRELQRRGIALENIYISMERNMKCAVGFCGHCQFGPTFICKDGPVFPYQGIQELLAIREL
jgi:hypothetical protein